MATLNIYPSYGGFWYGSVLIPYTTSYNRNTNQTTVTFSQASASYWGRQGYGTRMDCTITVKSDSNNSKTTTLTTYGYTQGDSTFYGTPSPSSVIVSHSGNGSKSITVSASLVVHVYATTDATYQTNISAKGSNTVTVGSRYSLSINQGTGSIVSVTRGSESLSDGSLISNGESLRVTFTATLGYSLTSHTVNGTEFVSGNTYSVSGNVSVISTATALSYVLTISQGSNTSVSVNRTESLYGGGNQGYLNNGAIIYYGDKLSISYSGNTGYTVTTHTINDGSFDSGIEYTVYQAITITTGATLNRYPISTSIGEHMDLSIVRTASPLGEGEIGRIANTGSTVFYGDVLVITAIPSSGYGIESMTINESLVSSPYTVTVVSPLSIVVIAAALGFVYIDSGSSIEKYKIVIDSGSVMNQYRAMIDTGSEIVPY